MNPPALPVTGKGRQTGRVLLRRSGTAPLTLLLHRRMQEVNFDRSGCAQLPTEDMQDGLTIDSLTIRNPFVAPASENNAASRDQSG